MDATERTFWIGVRKALIELIRAIEIRYNLESALITHRQRSILKRHYAEGGILVVDSDEQ